MPPEEPSQGAAVSVLPSVAVVSCGTRTTWNRRCPCVAVAAAKAYVFMSGRLRVSTPPAAPTALVAIAYS